MGQTEFGVNDPLARKNWSSSLAVEAEVKQYFRKFMGTSDDSIIKIQQELTKTSGDRIRVALRMKLGGDGIEGDNIIEGTSAEESLVYHACDVLIDQRRKGTKSKGKMSEQRVPYNMRQQGRNALSIWYAEDYDQQCFMYLSGARGIDTSFHVGLGYTGRAGNAFDTPDAAHIIYGGNASGLSDIDGADKMKMSLIEEMVAKAETTDPMIQPVKVNGEDKFILLMHIFQAYDIRTSISQGDWLEIHKETDGQKSPIYRNALGEYAGVILHKHRNIIRFDSTTGMAASSYGARALFLGAQAGIVAWGGGTKGVGRYSWNEETDDRGNALAITAGSIYGTKKSVYNSADFGVIAVDTWASDPSS